MIAFLFATLALAASPVARDLAGHPVDLSDAALVFWSMSDPAPLRSVAALEDAGLRVVLVNEDAASESSMLRPYARREGLDVPIVPDVEGALLARYHGANGDVLLVDSDGALLARSPADSTALVALLAAHRGPTAAR